MTRIETQAYPIGTPGQPWGEAEKAAWLDRQSIRRSYAAEVVDRLRALGDRYDLDQYGALSFDEPRYPLLALRTRGWREGRPSVLVTGGVHGYETSGVQGAIRFLETVADACGRRCNIVVAPCVSPWAYETVNRWNPQALDPNRSFFDASPAEESAALMRYVADLGLRPDLHVDLHETTDTDATEFRPALAARDGKELEPWEEIPDGFYLVGDADNPQPAFQAAIIRAVEQVTAIAPPDAQGRIIGEPLQQHGVIHYPVKRLYLCTGFTDATYSTTTEVYPDSPNVDAENCIQAQLATVTAALDYLLEGPGS